MSKKKFAILGGGISGLSFLYHSKNDCDLYELENKIGGHCGSISKKGFTFDHGGPHIIFSKDKKILKEMVSILKNNINLKLRKNVIFYNKLFVKYPFENGLYDLPPQERYECINDFINNKNKKPKNFEEWIFYVFGNSIAKKYLIPYNKKIWKYDLKKLGIDWVKGRIPKPPSRDILKSAVGVKTEGYTHQSKFFYPKYGGIESLMKSYAKKNENKIKLNSKVFKISRFKNFWIINNNKKKLYSKLISTLPVSDILKSLDKVPSKIKKNSKSLKFNSLITIMIGFKTKKKIPYTAIYVPEKKYIFHRLSFPKNFSNHTTPKNCMSICAEITTHYNSNLYKTPNQKILKKVIQNLKQMKLLGKDEKIIFSEVFRTKYSYVIKDKNYTKNINSILDYLKKINIISLGRNAEFKYINMDQAITAAKLQVIKTN